jgi:hypothetical protein
MSATHLANAEHNHTAPASRKIKVQHELLIAGMLFLAVLIVETVFIFAAADYITPSAAMIFAPVP